MISASSISGVFKLITPLRAIYPKEQKVPYRISDLGGDNWATKVVVGRGSYTIHGRNANGEDRQVTVLPDGSLLGHGPKGEVGYVGAQLAAHSGDILAYFAVELPISVECHAGYRPAR